MTFYYVMEQRSIFSIFRSSFEELKYWKSESSTYPSSKAVYFLSPHHPEDATLKSLLIFMTLCPHEVRLRLAR